MSNHGSASTTGVMGTREQDWDGLHNARCLGGLPARLPDGRPTTTVPGRVFRSPAPGRVFRSPAPGLLSTTGWAQLGARIRTVIDLRNDGEGEPYIPPNGTVVHHRPIEDQTDAEFMARFGDSLDTPVYYPEVLARWPHLVAGAFRAIANAPVGGLLIHCLSGRDRTGQITAMLLSLVGVPHEVIADDYALAVRATNEHLLAHPKPHERGLDDERVAHSLSRKRTALLGVLADLDTEAYLRSIGLTDEEIAAIQARLLRH